VGKRGCVFKRETKRKKCKFMRRRERSDEKYIINRMGDKDKDKNWSV
jgi:hypothetical protein